jgi:hypothetical protein
MRFMATSFGSENSRPIENIRKTTPNSARFCAPAKPPTQVERVRPDQRADEQVAEHRRQIHAPEEMTDTTEAASSMRIVGSVSIFRSVSGLKLAVRRSAAAAG